MNTHELPMNGTTPGGQLSAYAIEVANQIIEPPPGLGQTYALIIEHGGEVLYEQYRGSLPRFDGPGTVVTPDTKLLSWSMAKSITQLLLGIAHDEGLVDVDGPAPIAEWHGTPKAAITMRHLLQMASGLEWAEDYSDAGVSNVIEMLFGDAKSDTASYAASLPLAQPPGTTWVYSSGTTNILSRILGDALHANRTTLLDFMNDRLLIPSGCAPAEQSQLRFDERGTWIGSSFLYLTGRDWVRLGRMVANGGAVNGTQVIAQRWITEAQTPSAVPSTEEYGYGNHWWLWPKESATPDAFAALGYEGQHLIIVPSKDLVIARLGASPDGQKLWVRALLHRLIEAI
jgi:CubicO group peptidase (beta-lactamase class C family)